MPVAELQRHTACVNAVAWAPHSSWHMCTAGDDSQVGRSIGCWTGGSMGGWVGEVQWVGGWVGVNVWVSGWG